MDNLIIIIIQVVYGILYTDMCLMVNNNFINIKIHLEERILEKNKI